MPSLKTERSGFSLVELLVVMLVISTLLGFLMAALPRVMDAGRRTSCAANLHGVGQAVRLYQNDNFDKFPTARYMPPPWLSGDTDPPLNVALEAYLPLDSPAYTCPGDRVVHTTAYTHEDEESELKTERTTGMSYTFNVALSEITYEESRYATRLQRPITQTPVLNDFDGGTFEKQNGDFVTVDFFHATRNVLFADGHVDTP